MGIYIKSMEMPKNCSECPLMEYNEETGCYCYLTNQYASKTKPDGCPLIEIQDKCGKWSDKQVAYRDEYGDVHFGYQCSVCGAIVNKANYCGACGAKMESENG